MGTDRDRLLGAFHAAVAACDPAKLVREGLRLDDVAALVGARRRFGVAIGKAALAMARGVGPVDRGVIVIPARHRGATPDQGESGDVAIGACDFADIPSGWRVVESAHPFVDERSVLAAREARDVVDAAGEGDVVLALISGGASALVEEPIEGLTIEELGATTRAAMESGVRIHELNDLRATLSRVKRGGLVATCAAPVATLVVSDVIGDPLAIIGSGPTIGPWFVDDAASRHERDREGEPFALDEEALPRMVGIAHRAVAPRDRDVAVVVGSMVWFSLAAHVALLPQMRAEHVMVPLQGDVYACARQLVDVVGVSDARVQGTHVAWGEPTLVVPENHGEGGRAQQLALLLAKALRGTNMIAMVMGSDGVDGPPPRNRPAPAGAIVDGSTWDAIVEMGLDPERALERCDAGTVLDAVGALVVTGPTGINHGDLVVIGDRHD